MIAFCNFLFSCYCVFLSALIIMCNVGNVSGTTYSIDYSVLQKFWISTGGRNWDYPDTFGRAHWQFVPSADPCGAASFGTPWYGLTCEYLPPCDPGVRCRVTGIELNGVGLEGTIPTVIGQLEHLQVFSITSNPLLDGTIPTEISLLSSLSIFNVSYNALEGTIPMLGNLTELSYLHLGNNRLHGEVPDLWTLTNINFLYLFSNQLIGSLPSCIGNLVNLRFLQISENFFTGSIPLDIYRCTNLEYFSLAANLLTGSIPHLGLDILKHISWHDNYFTGQMPACYGDLVNLTFFRLDSNYFSGTMPSELSQLPYIQTVLLFNNYFHGSIHNVFSESQTELSVIDFSANALTGTIPPTVFNLPSLRILSLVKNCFHGTIPSDICNAADLEILSLDGITAGEKCSAKLWDPLHVAPSYFARTLPGTIPSCLWSLPRVNSISMSGNGIMDKLPDSVVLSDSLIYVDLSYNRLMGVIPDQFQRHLYSFFDMSHNKLCGDMELFAPPSVHLQNLEDYESNLTFINQTTLILAVNRLTGSVPLSFQSASDADLNVLNGNAFACASMTQLPVSDPEHGVYVCGSDELESSFELMGLFFAFGISLSVGLILWWILQSKRSGGYDAVDSVEDSIHAPSFISRLTDILGLLWKQQKSRSVKEISEHLVGNQFADSAFARTQMDISNASQFLKILVLYRNLCFQITLFALFACLPIYVSFYYAADQYYSHDRQYGWVYSMVFLSGSLPAAILLSLFSFISLYVLAKISVSGLEFYSINSITGSNNSNDFEDDCPSRHQSHVSSDSEISLLDARDSLVSLNNGDPLARASINSPPSSTLGRSSFMDSIQLKIPTKENFLQVGRDSMVVVKKTIDVGSEKANRACSYVLVFLANGSVTFVVNVLYVVAMASSISYEIKYFMQFFMAVYKIIWNSVFVRALINRLRPDRRRMQLHILMLTFNNLIAPCLAIAVGSSQCFEEIFTGSQSVYTSYSFMFCKESSQMIDPSNELKTICTHYEDMVITTEFIPPYVYSYQCAPYLIIAYVPVFIYSYACLAVFTPMFYAVVSLLPLSILKKYLPIALLSKIDGILRPQDSDESIVRYEYLLHAHSLIARYSVHLIVLLTFGLCYPPLAVVIFVAILSSTITWQILISRFITYGCGTLGGAASHHASDGVISPNSGSSGSHSEDSIQKSLSQLISSPLLSKQLVDADSGNTGIMSASYSSHRYSDARAIAKLQELESAIAGAWVNLRASSTLIFTCCIIFYIFEMFDVAGNSYSSEAISQIWVPVTGFSLLFLVRLFLWLKHRKSKTTRRHKSENS